MLRVLMVVLLILIVVAAGVFLFNQRPGPGALPDIVIRDATLYVSPDQPPLEHTNILLRNGKVETVLRASFKLGDSAKVLPCEGCVVMAGFWNSHVHFTEAKWNFAAFQPAGKLNRQLAEMLTSHGFTTVVDTGSFLANTKSLRGRVAVRNLAGPRIYTAGGPLYPPHGIPYYLNDTLPAIIRANMAQPDSPQDAIKATRRNFEQGADILKLFTGSWVAHGRVLPMPEPIAAAAVEEAHREHHLVFTHPSSLAGAQVAIASGVDVLAHAMDDTRGVDKALLQSAVDKHMSMIPTLKLFAGVKGEDMDAIEAEVRQFHELGGRLIFGTDVGYITDYSTAQEYELLAKAGLDVADILRMLTLNPAELFGVANERGSLTPGMAADVTVLGTDPRVNLAAFADVRYTIVDGRVVFSRQ